MKTLSEGVKYTGVGKMNNFRLSRYILETVQDRPVVTMDHKQEVIGHRSTSVPMTLSDLERRDARGPLFRLISVRIRSYYLTLNEQIRHGDTCRGRTCFRPSAAQMHRAVCQRQPTFLFLRIIALKCRYFL